ncbi:MAG TPA: ornithine carbamoyltransferase [Clostridiales bacterium]|nr:ornithine carbamoyltransferase [Clostridiales bacterium]
MDISQYRVKEKINHKHLLTLMDYSSEDIFEIVSLGIKLKHLYKKGVNKPLLKNKTLAMIFSKSSTRTRVSFEQGIWQLGGHALFLSASDIQLGRGETIHDTAKTLSRYGVDGVMIRTFLQSDVEELAKYGDFAVINGLTDDFHPCQALADIMTVYEVYGRLKGLKLVYSGDGNNVANSLILACAKTGVEIVCATPKGYEPNEEVVKHALEWGKVTITDDLEEAVIDADVVYTDVFFSMGQKDDDKKLKALTPYQINQSIMQKAKKDAVFMHCLPAHRGEEVTADVIDSPASVVFEQAENRMHIQKAVMTLLMKD